MFGVSLLLKGRIWMKGKGKGKRKGTLEFFVNQHSIAKVHKPSIIRKGRYR
jgi:hypothetical protein